MSTDFSILKTLGVIGFVETLPKTALLLTDADILNYIEEVADSSVTLQDIDKITPETRLEFSQIYVFTRSAETGRVRMYRRSAIDSEIISVTYQILPRLALAVGQDNSPVADSDAGPRLMVVQPGSGFELFAKMLRSAGVADYQEYITPEVLSWISGYSDFSLIRFLRQIQLGRTDGRLDAIFGMDVLAGLLEKGILRLSYVKRLYKKNGGEILYFANRDKCRQAVVNTYLKNTLYRGQGNVPAGERNQVFAGGFDLSEAFEQLKLLLEAEFKFEKHLEAVEHFKFITMWDLERNAPMVAENIAIFLHEHIQRSVEIEYDSWLEDIPEFAEGVRQLKEKISKLIK
ncbi:hypothetical protein KFE96_06950 [Kordiimonas sp. SCSIO 12603]|uniref:hypothetical protein n=1 Tax=Kordiimonas sp. SCSIO 12603 TaxID=2829596 RepID=UPI002103A993|nr:hypothetical protein [Kordiimonas sp. SCSIO 12603]UTW60040.1 hypothetical protein KFE96_06950 [Kordiimonas sp. SCSIO 12603]